MSSPYDTVISLLRTEKGTAHLPFNKFTFLVDIRANKMQVKKAIEQIYKVKVAKINTLIMPGKTKRIRYKAGKTADWKRAVVTLAQGDKIDVT